MCYIPFGALQVEQESNPENKKEGGVEGAGWTKRNTEVLVHQCINAKWLYVKQVKVSTQPPTVDPVRHTR